MDPDSVAFGGYCPAGRSNSLDSRRDRQWCRRRRRRIATVRKGRSAVHRDHPGGGHPKPIGDALPNAEGQDRVRETTLGVADTILCGVVARLGGEGRTRCCYGRSQRVCRRCLRFACGDRRRALVRPKLRLAREWLSPGGPIFMGIRRACPTCCLVRTSSAFVRL